MSHPSTADAAGSAAAVEPLCGNCGWGRVMGADLTKRVCFGAPPTPVLVGAAPAPGGAVSMRLELVRPTLSATEPGCAQHKRKAPLLIGAQS